MPEKATKNKDDERVEVFIPRGNRNEDPMMFVSVNGKNYLLPKGKTSRVPKCVATEVERAEFAQRMLDDRIDEMKYDGTIAF